MRDSMRSQALQACDGMKSAANLLRYLISIRKLKEKEWPNEPASSHRLWVVGSYPYLASKLDINWRTVMRAVKKLQERGFIKVHTWINSDTNAYEVDCYCVEKWMQRMPLWEQERIDDTPCHLTPQPPVTVTPPPCHRDIPPPVTMTPPPLICAPNTTITTNDGDRSELIQKCRELGVSTEHAELWMQKYTRQLIAVGVAYVRDRMNAQKIDNPAGLLNMFLRDPAARGFEMDPHGQWVKVGSKVKPSRYQHPPIDPEWYARYQDNEARRKKAANERRKSMSLNSATTTKEQQ